MIMGKPEVRCPDCHKKYAEWVEGRALFWCRRCKDFFVVDTRKEAVLAS